MVVAPAGAVRREGIGLVAPVAVDRGRGEHRARRCVLEQAGDIGLPKVRKELRAGEQVASIAVDQRLVQMPAARVVALERRPRHERGEAAKPAAHLARGRAKEQEVVRRAQRALRREGALDLSRAPFVLDRAQRQAHFVESFRQRTEHALHEIHVCFGMIGIPWFRRHRPDRHDHHQRQARRRNRRRRYRLRLHRHLGAAGGGFDNPAGNSAEAARAREQGADLARLADETAHLLLAGRRLRARLGSIDEKRARRRRPCHGARMRPRRVAEEPGWPLRHGGNSVQHLHAEGRSRATGDGVPRPPPTGCRADDGT